MNTDSLHKRNTTGSTKRKTFQRPVTSPEARAGAVNLSCKDSFERATNDKDSNYRNNEKFSEKSKKESIVNNHSNESYKTQSHLAQNALFHKTISEKVIEKLGEPIEEMDTEFEL